MPFRGPVLFCLALAGAIARADECKDHVASRAGEPAPSYADVEPIVRAKCAICHRGPFLDYTTFPFVWDRTRDQAAIVDEMIRQIRSGRMPPANGPAVTEEETRRLEAWRAGGMPP